MNNEIDRFNQLSARWKSETAGLSSIPAIVNHPAYQEIIAMGWPAVPLIIEEMRREPGHWFVALHRITGANPVTDENRGRFDRTTEAWLQWWDDRELVEDGAIGNTIKELR